MLLLIFGLIMFVGLVVVHEFGHFIFARRNGVDVEEFGIGFPPRLYKHKTRGGWLFTINLLPLGGFVKMKGEHDSDVEPGTFGAASVWAKTQIMAAGVVMNLITAFVLLTLLALVGMPKLIDNQFTVKGDTKVTRNEIIIGDVEKDSPASKVDIQAGDHLRSVTAAKVSNLPACDDSKTGADNADRTDCLPRLMHYLTSSKDLSATTAKLSGQDVLITYSRHGDNRVVRTTLRTKAVVDASKGDKGYLGVYPTDYTLQRSTYTAPVVALGLIKQFTVLTFQGLGKAVQGLGGLIAGAATGNKTARQHGQTNASSQVSGPVGIFVILKDGSSLGWQFVLLIIAVISLTLAIMNILPIPALDGGRLWLTLISRAINKPLSQRTEEIVTGSGFVALLLLIVLITIVDVKRFF